jgi:hypothetical protein
MMDGKKADPVSTDEVEEMSFGLFDHGPLWSRGGKANELAKRTPEELAERLVSLVEKEIRSRTFGSTNRERLMDDLSLFLAIWGRARKEEAEPALRKRVRDFLEKEDNIRKTLQRMLEQLNEALGASSRLFADAAPPEEEDGS